VPLAFQISLVLIVFSFGLRVTLADVGRVTRTLQLGRSLLAMFVVMPIAVIALVLAFELPPALEICLVALSFSPVPPLAPKKLIGAGGSDARAYGLMAVFSLLAIAIVPIEAQLIGRYLGVPFAVSPGAIARIVLTTSLAPLAAGMLVRQLLPGLAARLERPAALGGGILLAVAALVLVGAAWSVLVALAGDGTLLAIIAFVVIGLVVGHLLGGPGSEDRVMLALACAGRHPMIAFTLASASFPETRFGGTILLYLLVSAAVCVPYAKWAQKHNPAVAAPADGA
jgi:BASS family bile acid:Na+ symporter